MPRINKGRIINNEYVKNVSWNSAVLWMTKEISLPPQEMTKIEEAGVSKIVFVDKKKEFKMEFLIEDVYKGRVLKQVGQEPQYYWSINLGKKVSL